MILWFYSMQFVPKIVRVTKKLSQLANEMSHGRNIESNSLQEEVTNAQGYLVC